MTKSDPGLPADEPNEGTILLKRALIAIFGGLVLIFLLGVFAGYGSEVIKHGAPDFKDVVVLGAILILGGLTAWGMWRFWPGGVDEPVAPSVRSARRFFGLAVAVSVPLGLILAESGPDGSGVFSNGPMSPSAAAVVIGLWLIAGPVITWLWWRRIDEHEAGAYRDGAMVAFHGYMFAAPAWWVATRAGWLPPQDPMLMLLAVSALASVVWFARRFY